MHSRTISSLLLLALTSTVTGDSFDSSQCGKTKECFLPEKCAIGGNTNPCSLAFSHRSVNATHVEMELYANISSSGKLTAEKFYVAVGFSLDNKMGNDSVTECSRLPGEQTATIRASYNDYHMYNGSGTPTLSPWNRRIDGEAAQRSSIYSSTTAQFADGIAYCKFTQRIGSFSNALPQEFLTTSIDTQYYILLAQGATVDGALMHHHQTKPFVSDQMMALRFSSSSTTSFILSMVLSIAFASRYV